MKRNTSPLLLLVLLGGLAQLAATGCAVRAVYSEPVVEAEPVVTVESYPPRWYEGRWIYYREGGWGYWAAGSWYAYPPRHPIYVVHHYPRRSGVVHAYRPAHHRPARPVAVRSHRPHRSRPVVVHSARRGQPAPRATVHRTQPSRRGERVRAEQGSSRAPAQQPSTVRPPAKRKGSQEGSSSRSRSSSSRRGGSRGSGDSGRTR